MRYRQIDPFSRVFGIAWTALSLFVAGWGTRIVWNDHIWVGLGFVGAGVLSAAMGLAIAFERDPRRREYRYRNFGPVPNAKTLIFFLSFLIAGLAVLGGLAVPAVIQAAESGRWGKAATGIGVALVSIASGAGGLWVIFKKRCRQQQRSLKGAQEVAAAREHRLKAKAQRKRKRS